MESGTSTRRRRPRSPGQVLVCVGCGIPRGESNRASLVRVLRFERGFWRTVEITHREFQCPFCALRTVWHERHLKVLGLERRSKTLCDCRQTVLKPSLGTRGDPLFGEGPILGPSATSLLAEGR